jgi:hypothetical protein
MWLIIIKIVINSVVYYRFSVSHDRQKKVGALIAMMQTHVDQRFQWIPWRHPLFKKFTIYMNVESHRHKKKPRRRGFTTKGIVWQNLGIQTRSCKRAIRYQKPLLRE